MLISVEHLLCVGLYLCFTNLNPYNPGRRTLSPFTHEETALVKVATGFSDRKAELFSTIQIGSCWRVLWRRSWGGEPWVVSASVEHPSPTAEARLLP